jgi:hypothetical protein
MPSQPLYFVSELCTVFISDVNMKKYDFGDENSDNSDPEYDYSKCNFIISNTKKLFSKKLLLFGAPEPKAKVGFSDQKVSVMCPL